MLIRYLFGNCRRRRPYNIETTKQHYPKKPRPQNQTALCFTLHASSVGFVFNIKHSSAHPANAKGWIDRALHKSMLHRQTRVHASDQEGCVHIKVEVMLELLSFSGSNTVRLFFSLSVSFGVLIRARTRKALMKTRRRVEAVL